MQRRIAPSQRSAFTLLEVLLALGIGLLLLAGLYVALDLQFHLTNTGRDVVQQSTLARSLLARIDNDITSSLGPPDAGRLLNPSSQSGSSQQMSGSSQQPTTGQTPTTGQGGTTTANAPQTQQATTSQPTSTSTLATTAFNLAVQGDSERLTLFITRVPQPPPNQNPDNTTGSPGVCDIRRITYWLLGGSAEPMGLARQEVLLITSDDAAATPEEMGDVDRYLMADEVKSLSFSYFDGKSWTDSWDGGSVPVTAAGSVSPDGTGDGSGGSGGSLPTGPPLAIAVTLGLLKTDGSGELQMYRHVISIPTANGIR